MGQPGLGQQPLQHTCNTRIVHVMKPHTLKRQPFPAPAGPDPSSGTGTYTGRADFRVVAAGHLGGGQLALLAENGGRAQESHQEDGGDGGVASHVGGCACRGVTAGDAEARLGGVARSCEEAKPKEDDNFMIFTGRGRAYEWVENASQGRSLESSRSASRAHRWLRGKFRDQP